MTYIMIHHPAAAKSEVQHLIAWPLFVVVELEGDIVPALIVRGQTREHAAVLLENDIFIVFNLGGGSSVNQQYLIAQLEGIEAEQVGRVEALVSSHQGRWRELLAPYGTQLNMAFLPSISG